MIFRAAQIKAIQFNVHGTACEALFPLGIKNQNHAITVSKTCEWYLSVTGICVVIVIWQTCAYVFIDFLWVQSLSEKIMSNKKRNLLCKK